MARRRRGGDRDGGWSESMAPMPLPWPMLLSSKFTIAQCRVLDSFRPDRQSLINWRSFSFSAWQIRTDDPSLLSRFERLSAAMARKDSEGVRAEIARWSVDEINGTEFVPFRYDPSAKTGVFLDPVKGLLPVLMSSRSSAAVRALLDHAPPDQAVLSAPYRGFPGGLSAVSWALHTPSWESTFHSKGGSAHPGFPLPDGAAPTSPEHALLFSLLHANHPDHGMILRMSQVLVSDGALLDLFRSLSRRSRLYPAWIGAFSRSPELTAHLLIRAHSLADDPSMLVTDPQIRRSLWEVLLPDGTGSAQVRKSPFRVTLGSLSGAPVRSRMFGAASDRKKLLPACLSVLGVPPVARWCAVCLRLLGPGSVSKALGMTDQIIRTGAVPTGGAGGFREGVAKWLLHGQFDGSTGGAVVLGQVWDSNGDPVRVDRQQVEKARHATQEFAARLVKHAVNDVVSAGSSVDARDSIQPPSPDDPGSSRGSVAGALRR